MNPRNLRYGFSILFFITALTGFLFFREALLFQFYDINHNIWSDNTAESFAAYRRIAPAKKVFFIITLVLTVDCLLLSYWKKTGGSPIGKLAIVFFYLSAVALVILCTGLLLGLLAPTRII